MVTWEEAYRLWNMGKDGVMECRAAHRTCGRRHLLLVCVALGRP